MKSLMAKLPEIPKPVELFVSTIEVKHEMLRTLPVRDSGAFSSLFGIPIEFHKTNVEAWIAAEKYRDNGMRVELYLGGSDAKN